ncbi:MAG: hypothetical protein ACRCZW_03590, partial [Lactobacillaceae bacterium]
KNYILKKLHDYSGHRGVTVLYNNLKNIIGMKNLFREIAKTINECQVCKKFKLYYGRKLGTAPISATKPFERISIDIFGPFNLQNYDHAGKKESGYILTITDIFSRYTRLYFNYKIDSKKIIEKLIEWRTLYGKPKCLISDNGRQYTSNILKEHLTKEDIIHSLVPIYSPKSNGISESINKTIAFMLSIKKGKRIKDIIKVIEKTININYNRTLSAAPFTIINKYSPYDPFKRRIELQNKLNNLPIIKFKLNDMVYYKDHKSKKLEQKYRGKKKIVYIGNKGRWVKLEGENNFRHVSDLKL